MMNHRLLQRFLISFVFATALVFASSSTLAELDSPLEGQVERYIKSLRRQGKIKGYERTAWLVYDFKTGKKLVSINADTPLQAASMIKPFLALAFFHRVKEKRIVYGPASRKHMEAMIQHSNNESTNWVMKQVGGPAAVQSLLKKHYPRLSRNISIVEYIPQGGRTYRNRAAASDYSRYLYDLWTKKLPSSDEMLRIMNLPGRDRLYTDAKRIPVGTTVYNKTGSTAMCCGDMGILSVKCKNGNRYPYIIIGVIESGVKSRSYGSWISFRADVIRQVSNLVYTDMKKRHNL